MSICTNCIHKIVCDHESKYRTSCSQFLTERPQWIPCSKRLPEEIGDYIVTEDLSDGVLAVYVSSFGHVRTGKLCFYYEDEDGRAITIDDIVAWMPLPIPYQEEGDLS